MESLLAKYQTLVENYKFSPLYNKWAFLVTVAACLERRCWKNEEALGYLYPDLYAVFVGPPASRKSTTAKIPKELFLDNLENAPITCSNQLTPAALIDELKDAGAKRYENKTSPLFVLASEFTVFFQDIGGGSMVDLLLDFYDTRRPGQVWRKNTKKWGKQEMPNPSLTILGCTTPTHLMKAKVLETGGLGLTSRVLFVCEPQFIPGATRFPKLDEKLREEIAQEFIRICSITGEFISGPGVEEAIETTINNTNRWIADNPGATIMMNFMARKPTQIRKVAMLLCAMRNSRKIISREDIFEAEALVTELEANLPYAFHTQIIYRDANLAAKVLERIPLVGGISEEKLLHGFLLDGQAIPDSEELRGVMKGLEKQSGIKLSMQDGKVIYRRVQK